MKARIRIEATVEVNKKDYPALESAGPLELVQTAQMQCAKIRTSVEKTRKPAVKTEKAKEPSEPDKEKDDGENSGQGGGL